MTTIDPLVLPVDTTQAVKGSTDLDKLTASGERMETQFTKTGKATDGWQQNMRGVDAAMKSTADRAIELSQATQRIIDRYDPLGTKMRALQSDMAMLQREMGNSSTDAAIKSFQGLEAEIERTSKLMQTAGVAGFDEVAKAADRGAFATVGAKRELIVLGHEAMQGNFSRMPGSFMVLAERMDLTSMLMSPMTLGIIGIGVAAVATIVYIHGMSTAIDDFNKSLVLTGGYAGQTRDSIASMADSIQTSATGGISAANTVLAQLAATGHFTGGEMDSVGRAVLKFSELSGKSSEDAIKQFEGMSKGVADWAAKSNESYHFLTGAQYDHIAALEKQGDKSLAVMETMRLMNASMDTHKEHLSVITMAYRGWGMIIDDVNSALRKMIFPTVGESFQTESAKLLAMKRQAQQEEGSWGAGPAVKAGWDVKIKEQQTLVAGLAKTAFKEDLATQQKAAADSLAELGMAARRKDDLLSSSARSNSQKEKDAVKEYLDGQTAMLKAGMKIDDDIEQANKLKYLHDSNNPDAKAPRSTERRDSAAILGRDIEAIRKEQADIVSAYTNSQKLIEAVHAAGLMDEQSFYGSTVALLALESQAKQDGLIKELQRLGLEQNSRKLATDERAKNQTAIMKAEADLQKVVTDSQVAVDVAGVKHKAVVDKVTSAYTDAQAAAQKFIDTALLAHSRDLSGMGQGNDARAISTGQNQIGDKYTVQALANEKFKTDNSSNGAFNNSDAQQKYDDEVKRIADFKPKALAEYNDYIRKKKALESNWQMGAKEGLSNYLTDTQNVYKSMEGVVTKSFKGMEDALVSFAMTGKLDFSSLANSIIADMIRIQVQQSVTGPLAKMVTGYLTGGASIAAGSDASGYAGTMNNPSAYVASANGNVFNSPSLSAYSGGIYDTPKTFAFASGAGVFAEAGPEAIMPLSRGSDGKLGVQVTGGNSSGGSAPAQNITVVQNFTVGDVASMSQVRQAVAGSEKRIQSGIGRSMQYGGALA